MAWWAQVTETPEDKSKIVFRRGILIGLNGLMEIGGHICPSSTVGEILLWKNAQKNDTKKNTSDRMNNTIPVFSPFITTFEWCPCDVDSRWMSRHHINEINRTVVSAISKGVGLNRLIHANPPRIMHIPALDARIGHGLISTRWNGLNFLIISQFLSCIK
jgi:hypothetical protein